MRSTRTLAKDWILTRDALDRFLGRLDADRERAGGKYEILRLKLIKYFEWQGSVTPEDMADETVNRVAHKLADKEEIRNFYAYVFGTARHVLSEQRKERLREEAMAKEFGDYLLPAGPDDAEGEHIECCEKCLSSLPEDDRELIVSYYSTEKKAKIDEHKRMADRLSISLNSMRIRVHRIKQRLEKCIIECEARWGRE